MASNNSIDKLCESLMGVEKDNIELDKKLNKIFKHKYKKCESMNFFAGMFDISLITLTIMVWGMGICSQIIGMPITVYALEGGWYGELINIVLLGIICLSIIKCLYNNKVTTKCLKPTFSQRVFGLYRVEGGNVWINPFGASRTAFIMLIITNLIALGNLFKGTALEWGTKGIEYYLYMYPVLNIVLALVTLATVIVGIYVFSRGQLKGTILIVLGNVIGIFNIYNICNNVRIEKIGMYAFIISFIVTIIVSIYYFIKMKK